MFFYHNCTDYSGNFSFGASWWRIKSFFTSFVVFKDAHAQLPKVMQPGVAKIFSVHKQPKRFSQWL